MMKKTLAICLGLALILTLCGTFAGALASEVENGIDAIEDAMMKGNTNTSSFFDGMDDLREGTSADTVPTPDDFPSKYNYGSGKIQDYRLAYHHFLASDKKINSIPVLENSTDKRMDIAIFDAALSYTADPDNINSITIVELKRPQRDDADNDPVLQVLKYVRNIKDGKIKKKNGRDFGDVSRVAFYCYVIGDLTPSLKESAERVGG